MKKIIKFAKMFNSLRIFPRLMIGSYLWLLSVSVYWFMGLEAPTPEQSGMLIAIIGAGAAWFTAYVATGKIHEADDE